MSEQSVRDRVVLLHGWPGLPSDFDRVVDLLPDADVTTPDLRGFGTAFDGDLPVSEATAEAHARRVLAQIGGDDGDADSDRPRGRTIIAGYDIGSRIAQAALRLAPGRFDGAVLTPAYPGIGDRSADPALASVFWYQHFHREQVAVDLIDGRPDAVRSYLDHIWRAWRGPDAASEHPRHDEVIAAYSRPGAFAASIQWYRANRGYTGDSAPIATPAIMLWPTDDPLFPIAWADRLPEHFTDAVLTPVPGSGHFVPIEAPDAFAAAIRALLADGDAGPPR
ncbi:alpha/beta hydrolase [Microbacterium sp. NPDC089320]|uniref:alpha/beta fold hydrolase n=1 Tax=Microbacterium sp. NPDC089320 TaxID=3155182 RepID=UPI00343CAFBD